VHRAALVSMLCVALAGCGGGGVQSEAWESGGAASSDAQANVRAAIPAMEAYYADNGTYAGVSMEKLRATYDSTLPEARIALADKRTYCIESTVGGETFSKHGPAADITAGTC
jgi:hypothetical protein